MKDIPVSITIMPLPFIRTEKVEHKLWSPFCSSIATIPAIEMVYPTVVGIVDFA